MGDGVQPVDKYVLFRDNPDLAIQEMKEYNLTDEEMKVIEKHLGKASYVSDSQEEIMLLSMDEKIANFSILEANELRKAVARIDAEVLKRVKKNFFEKGKQNNNSKNILQYVWDKQIMPQSGYGFSTLHSASYSLIALQNMNLAHKYPAVYWNTACLSVNSGADETSDADKTSSYGRVAAAIGDMQQRNITVTLPNINTASFGFKPNAEENSIVFGLRGIHGIGSDLVHTIISNRPYTSFQDFLARLIDTKLVQNAQMLQLIKAGCFDSLLERTEALKQYISHVFEPRKKLTLASFNMLHNELSIFPSEFDLHTRFYNFRRHIMKSVHSKSSDRKTKNRLFSLDQFSTEFLYEHFSEDCIVDYNEETSLPIIAEWLFEKEYDAKMQVVKDWLVKDTTTKLVNDLLLESEWNIAGGNNSISFNEMSSLSYYYSGHELAHLNTEKYNISNFTKLPSEPVSVRQYEWRGREMHEYQISRIAGTVLDKDKNRHTVTILTTDGVVVVKLFRNSYSFMDRQLSRVNSDGKKTVIERSWFVRGNKLLITGFRRGNQFVPKVYRNSIYEKAIVKISSIDDEGDLSIQSERASMNG